MLQGDLEYLSEEHPHKLRLLQWQRNDKKKEGEGNTGRTKGSQILTPSVNHNIEQAFCPLPFFFFCLGG